MENHKKKIKCELYRDSMQNYKKYAIPPAQLIIADVPYNVGNNFYGCNPMWYNGGDNKNGESKFAGKAAFNSDFNFNLYEFFHFCSKMLKKDDTKQEPPILKNGCWLPTRDFGNNRICATEECNGANDCRSCGRYIGFYGYAEELQEKNGITFSEAIKIAHIDGYDRR